MFKIFIKICFFLLFLTNISHSEVIKKIDVQGNKRLSLESIVVFASIEINQNLNENDLNQILKNLYNTNFFKQVKLSIKDNTLIIEVIENPIIENLEIKGIKSTKLSELLLDSMELRDRKSFVQSTYARDLNLIKNIIKSQGYYFSNIETTIRKNEELNSIRLIYDIDLGKKAKINEIKFIGDKKIKDRKLKNIITTEESKFWKFLSNRFYLDRERIALDKRLITNYYKNNGYFNVKVDNSFVEFKNNGSFKLIFNINAGNKFFFNNLIINIPDDYDPKYFVSIDNLLNKLEQKMYSLNKIDKILTEIDKIALSKQYEFIDAKISEDIIDENKLDITISLIETEKFYVERINILGNSYTLEEVIRNSLIVDEGDPYNKILFNKSINNLKAKNIFGSVKSKIKDGSNQSLKIVDITVEEKATGEISLAAGVGTSGGTIGGGLKENNFLGKGVRLDTNLTVSKNSVKGAFVYSKPNFNYTDNTLFTSIRSVSTDNIVDYGYKTTTTGVGFGTTFEQYENLYFSPEVTSSFEDLETTSTASKNLKKQAGNYFDLYFNYGLNYDLRNQRFRPSDGYITNFSQELPIVSENNELRNSFSATKYQKLPSEMIGQISFFYSIVNTVSSDADVRISKRLYLPANKLRGFESGKIGPIENDDFIGGNQISAVNVSTTLPQVLPSFQNTDLSLFFDAANVWDVDYNKSLDNSKIRSATGVALDLMTPIGPLSFSLAYPISKSSRDKTETFRFNLGTSF